jgi:hypothetical protein
MKEDFREEREPFGIDWEVMEFSFEQSKKKRSCVLITRQYVLDRRITHLRTAVDSELYT